MRACRPIQRFSLSPITATIWRNPTCFRLEQQPGDERLPHALSAHVFTDIDAVFSREAVGRAVTDLCIVRIAEHSGRVDCDQPGPSTLRTPIEPLRHFFQ